MCLCCTDHSVSCWLWKTDTCKVLKDPAVCRDVHSNQEISSAEQQGSSSEFKDPSALAPLPGQFCWRIYSLINPTLSFFLTSGVRSSYCDHLILTLPLLLTDMFCPSPDNTPCIDAGRGEHLLQFLTPPCCLDLCASTRALRQLLNQLVSWMA